MIPGKSPPERQQVAIGNENIQVIGSNNIIQRITNIFQGDTESQRTRRNRRAMLELVKNTWIKGVLEKSLYNEVLIRLGMEERHDAVDPPWDMQIQMPDKENLTLPIGTTMMEIFDKLNGAMLILGEPGSGKTTMLLELARDCIERAEQDDNQPIPVYFNLSSWDGKQSLEEWLVVELQIKYEVLDTVAQSWVMNNEMQLLLDGLDEVSQENHRECVIAINEFRQKHGLTMPIVICSRIADYEALEEKLNLRGAVILRALSTEQIDEYFNLVGPELKYIHQFLKNDEILIELVKQPLMLSIMTLAYQGWPIEIFSSENLNTVEARRKHLFDTYIQQMFRRVARTKNEQYSPKQAKCWLGWLAKKMIEHNQVPYYLESMQPEWLPKTKTINITDTLFKNLFNIEPSLIPKIREKLNLLTGNLGAVQVKTVDRLRWNWWQAILGLFYGLLITLVIGLVSWIFSASGVWSIDDLVSIMNPVFFLVGPFLGPIGFLIKGLKVEPIVQTTYPGQRISLSIRNSLIASLLFGLVGGLFFGLYFGPIEGDYLIRGFSGFVIFAWPAWIFFGGSGILGHYTLRRAFAKRNYLPYRIVPFLDYCVDRIFLRRVGGGYIFVHRLLMEHFADMYPESE